ncbi:unnamed protein product [Prorocentrum cordatum]|uniref:Uncharacterized protein n=1 Tax=Prorocentrum cordatum TaxID=2364126 RepID=A0ABN9RY28_9DINO|nr:unnamed protein product [Polarella glacialis]
MAGLQQPRSPSVAAPRSPSQPAAPEMCARGPRVAGPTAHGASASSSSTAAAGGPVGAALQPTGHGQGQHAGTSGCDLLRRDVLAFRDRQADALADLILHLGDGSAALANAAVVEARLPALLSAAEPLGEADAALVVDEHGRRAGAFSACPGPMAGRTRTQKIR